MVYRTMKSWLVSFLLSFFREHTTIDSIDKLLAVTLPQVRLKGRGHTKGLAPTHKRV
jgi:hypothetical protein